MKIRTGFVSNSSSSSFVVARKQDYTAEDIKNYLLETCRAKLENFAKDSSEYCYDIREINEGRDLRNEPHMQGEELIRYIATSVADDIYLSTKEGAYGSMVLDNWVVGSGTASSEDGDITELFLYETFIKGNENLKFAYGD